MNDFILWWEDTGQYLPQNNFDLARDAYFDLARDAWEAARESICVGETSNESALRSVLADLVKAYDKLFTPDEVMRCNIGRDDWIEATVAYRSAKAVLRL